MLTISDMVKEIIEMRKDRNVSNLPLRVAKLCEEAGEASGAIVSVLTNSYKNLDYIDVIEEVIDTWIVATDTMFTSIPSMEKMSNEEKEKIIVEIMQRKLNKWKSKIIQGNYNS